MQEQTSNLLSENNDLEIMLQTEYIPDINEVNIPNKSIKLPIDQIPALGIVATSIGHTGIYKMVVPKGIKGAIHHFKDGSGISGNILGPDNSKIVGRARFVELPINPTQVFIAAAMMTINEKLDKIVELQEDILNFLNQDKESKIKGDMNTLSEIFNNLKFNWNNDKYVSTNLVVLKDIKRQADANVIFYENRINQLIDKKKLLHFDFDVNNKLEKLQKDYKYYKLSNYMYTYASFVETILYGNFDSSYLRNVLTNLEKRMFKYNEVYSKSYVSIKKLSETSFESGLTSVSSKITDFGSKVSKSTVLNRLKLDNKFELATEFTNNILENKLQRVLSEFTINRIDGSHVFLENLRTINNLYNDPMELYFDDKQIYLVQN